jgi:hypothetical protein
MPNWFENNVAKSVITYTFIVAGATWAGSTFILEENRIALVRSELESQKSLTEQYKAKTDLLQKDLDILRTENSEYKSWLGQSKDAVPIIVPRILELKQQIIKLETEATELKKQNPATGSAKRERNVGIGRAFIDEDTGIIFTLKKTSPDRLAAVVIKLPDQVNYLEQSAIAGQQWKFKAKGKPYILTLLEVNFYADTVNLLITAQ